ncbi:MAG: ribonuclease III [Polymorphobacter sp.]|uniref:ribonuclease III n=1 Tax=Polymorphobacter sp. TaxID=1909290 RepID=UPI003A83CDDC
MTNAVPDPQSEDGRRAWAEARLGHRFENPALLRRALTHSSAARGNASYQRLEFLGDRVLGCAIAAKLFAAHDEAEGKLTARLHALVEGPANAEVARHLGVEPYVILEPSARMKGLAATDNVLGDIAEALVAALFLDAGWDKANAFVLAEWGRLEASGRKSLVDPKSRLQEWALKRRRGTPSYIVLHRDGPDHAPVFTIEARVRGEPPVQASGPNKQEAEKAAALLLLESLPQ